MLEGELETKNEKPSQRDEEMGQGAVWEDRVDCQLGRGGQ